MKKPVFIAIIYTAIILVVFTLIMLVVSTGGTKSVVSLEEITNEDIDSECYVVEMSAVERYCNKLLSPQEIGAHTPDEYDTPFDNYITYRAEIPVTDGKSYGITYEKSDYAVNIFADGKLIAKTGNVSDNKEDFVPAAAAFEAFFTGKGDKAEIIIQQANYNHYKHYSLRFIVGPSEQISHYNRQYLLENVTVTVVLLTVALINIGIFLCFSKNREILYFSLMCFMAAINVAFPYITAYVLPTFSWYVSHKLETCSLIAVAFFAVCYAEKKFPKYVNKIADHISLMITGAVLALYLFTPSVIYTRFSTVSVVVLAIGVTPAIILLLINILKKRKTVSLSNKLALIGIMLYFFFAFSALLEYLNFYWEIVMFINIYGLTTAASAFAFFNSIALSIDFRMANELLEESKVREKELSQANEMLTKLDKIRESFLADLSHELKTPLTVIASNVAVASKQITRGKADEMTASSLNNVEREAVRLGHMVERLKTSAISQHSEKMEILNVSTILNAAADFCIPLCARNGNALEVKCDDTIRGYASANTLFHCLYNLITNATRHCSNNTIELIARKGEKHIIISVLDHGSGMTDDEKRKAFERGFSGDSSTGIGLPLCRELVENEDGTIYLEDTPGGGLTVSFTIKEADEYAEDTVS